jgi:hypothetical protein
MNYPVGPVLQKSSTRFARLDSWPPMTSADTVTKNDCHMVSLPIHLKLFFYYVLMT